MPVTHVQRLTHAQCLAAKPRDRVYELVDGGGLSLCIEPSGTRTWRLRYRVAGRRKRVCLGNFPDVKLTGARAEAARLRGNIAHGGDPAAERMAERAAMRMADLFGAQDDEGWYLTTYVRGAGRLSTGKTEAGIASDRYRIGKHLRGRPALMAKPIAEVTPADLDRIKREVSPGTWRQLRAILRVAFAHAVSIGVIATNPVERVKAVAARKAQRFLAHGERRRLDAALAEAEQIGPAAEGGLSASLVRLFRLLALTGMRLGEGLSLRWEWIVWQHSVINLPTSKTGAKPVPLTEQALAFLQREHDAAAAGLEVGTLRGLVCPDRNGRRLAANNVERAWRALRGAAGLDGVDGKAALRLHDLRHSWASDAVSAGVPLYVVGAVLGHRQPSTTARYAHLHDAAIREGLAKAGAAIERASNGAADVVSLPAPRHG